MFLIFAVRFIQSLAILLLRPYYFIILVLDKRILFLTGNLVPEHTMEMTVFIFYLLMGLSGSCTSLQCNLLASQRWHFIDTQRKVVWGLL